MQPWEAEGEALSLRCFASLEVFGWQPFPLLCCLVKCWHHPRVCLVCVCRARALQAQERAVLRPGPSLSRGGAVVRVPGGCNLAWVLLSTVQSHSSVIWHHLEIRDELCQDLQKYVVRESLLKNLFLNKKNLWRVREDIGKQSLAKGLTAGSVAELAVRAGQKSQSLSHWKFSLRANEISRASKELVGS